jgi:Histidine kinase-, DNA gyrase B-, and HSP90-like ATPase
MNAVPDATGDETMRMEVDKIGFLLERMGRDCDDLQFLRELTQNAIEAGATRIHWDFDPYTFDATGVQKLCCIDDGCGMTPEEMRQYINRLSASGQRQALDANYGVGAKVATATRNPTGVIYQSWRDGKGAMVQLWRDPDSEEYGLRRFELDDGQWSYWIPLSTDAKPEIIGEHGTKVVLLGRDEEHITMAPPEGLVATPSRWVSRYLNARYFDLPKDLEIKAREGWDAEPDDKRNLMRGVRGQGRFLSDHTLDSGTASLADCDVHWWILDEPEKRKSSSDLVNTGHAATLWQNELYEMRTGRAGVSRLHQFGIIFGYERVVLYIEPHNGSKQPLTSNTARTQLLLQGQGLPYADWAAEFRENMPQQLRDFMDAVIAGAQGADHQEAIAERLKHYRKLYRLSRYRLNQQGRLTLAEPVLQRPKSGSESESGEERVKEQRPKRPRDRTGRLLAAMLAADGETGDHAPPTEQDLPKVTWVSLENKLRSTPEYLDDRAATYISEVNEIHANADFRAFTDMIDYWCDQYKVDSGNQAITDIVHEWFEQALVETVLGCQALQGEKRWPPDQIEKALSEESLTAAVLQRYHLANAIKRSLGAKMGSLRDRDAA